MATTGERIRRLREEAGIFQADLGKMLGISKSVMSDYENDKLQPNIEKLRIMADLFKTTMDYITGRSEDRVIGLDEEDVEIKSLLRSAINRGQIKEIIGRLLDLPEEDMRTLVRYIEFLEKDKRK